MSLSQYQKQSIGRRINPDGSHLMLTSHAGHYCLLAYKTGLGPRRVGRFYGQSPPSIFRGSEFIDNKEFAEVPQGLRARDSPLRVDVPHPAESFLT
jgi:hypothetical protein